MGDLPNRPVWEIIDDDAGGVIVEVRPGDCAVGISGAIDPV